MINFKSVNFFKNQLSAKNTIRTGMSVRNQNNSRKAEITVMIMTNPR